MVLVKSIEVGTQGHLDYSPSLLRLSFMKSFTHLVMIPIPHWCSNKFMCSEATENYLANNIIDDKFYALSMDGMLWCWSIVTCKLLSKKTIEEYNFKDWMVAKKARFRNFCKVLIRTKDKIPEEIKDEDYFVPYQF
jgi:hypothetical protein